MTETPKLLFMGQAVSQGVFDLAKMCAKRFGATWLHTGTELELDEREAPDLRLIDAPPYDNSTVSARARTWLQYTAAALPFALKTKGRPTLVLSSNPPMLALVGYLCHRLKGWPYVVRVLDVYPDVTQQRDMFDAKHPITRLWSRFNRVVYSKAEAVITLGDVMAERVRQYADDARVIVIPTWVDTETILPMDKADNWFAKEHGLVDGLSVLYSGNYGESHDLSGVFEAMGEFEQGDGVRFVLIGGGGRADEMQAAVASNPQCGLYLPFQPFDVLPYSMTSGDVALVTLGKGTEGISMPSKCYFMMAAGCAILGVSEGDNDLKRVIEAYECGVSLTCDDSAGIAAAIRRFKEDPAYLKRLQANARKAAEEVFDTKVVNQQYMELLTPLVS